MAKQLIKNLFLLLMLIQITAGSIWGVQNMTHLARFHDTQLYIFAADSMVIDEYMGILYPLLIAVAKAVEGVIGLPFYSFLYLLQLGCAFGVMVRFFDCMDWIKEKGRKRKALIMLIAFYGVTFPMLMQLHMAVLPYSLAWSIIVLLIGEGIGALRSGQAVSGRLLIRLCGLWLLSFLLLPEYCVLAGMPVCIIFLEFVRRDKKSRARLLMAFLSTVLCFGVAAKNTQVPGSLNRMQKTVGATMVNRFVWPYFLTNSYFWDDRVKDTFDSNELLRFAGYPEAVLYEFGPVLEEKYGRVEANEIYWNMAVESFRLETKQTVFDLGRDFAANLCPPGALQWQLTAGGTTRNAWNYGQLQEVAPVTAKYYAWFSMAGWLVMSVLGMVMVVGKWCQRLRQKVSTGEVLKSHERMEHRLLITVLVSEVVISAFWYALSTSMQDYKNVMFGSFIWVLFAISCYLKMISHKCSREKGRDLCV